MKYLFLIFTAASVLIACSPKTTEIVVIDEAAEESPSSSTDGDMPKADIGEGKVVFLKNCIDCHYGRQADNIPKLIDSYTEAEWAEILPRMIKNAELDQEKSRQVAAYIAWELKN